MQTNEPTIPAFPAFPCTARYVALGAIEEAVARVVRAIDAREAAAIVIGPPGTGKSLLCGLIAKQFQASHRVVVLGETPLEDREALLRHLLHHLGVDAGLIKESDPHLALTDYVNDPSRQDEGLIIIVDEAQKLSADVIEAIRMVTNINRNHQPRVFALLCGGVKLDETLVDSSLESFTQRAATRCYLHPMNAEETRHYIEQTISRCGADPEATITGEAIAAIHHACSGIPRLINQLMTQGIDCAADADQALITEQFIDRAWAQLQQLPGPMVDEPQISLPSSPIEFGELEEPVAATESIQWPDSPPTDPPKTDWQHTDQEEAYEFAAVDTPPVAALPIETAAVDFAPAARTAAPIESLCSTEGDQGCGENVDIELESSSAVWIDEPVAMPQPHQAASRHSDSQPVALFGEFDHEEDISVGNGFALQQPSAPSAPANLESLLREEIVGAGPVGRDAERQPKVISLHDGLASHLIGPPNADQSVVRDDSDLLVIEDEVVVHPIDSQINDNASLRPEVIDFQAMLTKMRGAN